MLKGIFYNALAKYSGVIFSIIITAILSRLLTPEEFGVVALVIVFIAFFNLLGNMGIGPAIVQHQNLSDKDLASIFTFSIYMSGFFAGLFFLSAEAIADFYEENVLIPIVQLLSICVFFNIASIVPRALNKKKLKFKQMGIVNVAIQVLTGGVAMILAFYDFSYYAIVFQNILSGFLLFAIFYFLYPIQFILKIKLAPLKEIASFSSYQFGYNLLSYFSRNLDSILIGKFLGNAPLGYYNKSYSLMQLPVYNLTHVITPVMHPVLAIHQDNLNYIYKTYEKVVKILASIGFPLSIFLYYSASPIILLMFGSQWDRSVPVFEVLALSVSVQICSTSTNAIYQAINRTKLLFISGLITSILLVTGILFGIFYGRNIEMIGYGLLVAFIINFFQDFYILINKALKESFLEFLKIFILPSIVALVSFLLYYLVTFLKYENKFMLLFINSIVLIISLIVVFIIPINNRKFIVKWLKKYKI